MNSKTFTFRIFSLNEFSRVVFSFNKKRSQVAYSNKFNNYLKYITRLLHKESPNNLRLMLIITVYFLMPIISYDGLKFNKVFEIGWKGANIFRYSKKCLCHFCPAEEILIVKSCQEKFWYNVIFRGSNRFVEYPFACFSLREIEFDFVVPLLYEHLQL